MNIEATHLGKKSNYPQHYDPTVLVAVSRYLNREQYNIKDDNLPFLGLDVWHAYEFSFLLNNGTPVVGILKIVYPCINPYIVESKSLKLYLNSFNMDCFGNCFSDGIEHTKNTVQSDLEKLLKCKVDVSFFNHKEKQAPNDFSSFEILEEKININNLNCSIYSEDSSLLQLSGNSGEIVWGTHLLRSNCKITNQPDWGSCFIHLKGKQLPTPKSFLKYIISLRNENHFHEEICEMVFKRILDKFQPEELTLSCLYTRRGGIDINPIRSLTGNYYPKNLSTFNLLDTPSFRQ